jgi:O-antigen/teichoic acid export membrane protein
VGATDEPRSIRREAFRRRLGLLRASTGVRASAVLLAGTTAVLAGAYAYNLVCIRWLGAADYGDVAALTALSTILLLPLLGVQAALAREVAAFRARGNDLAVGALLTLTLRRGTIASILATLVLLAASPAIAAFLNISSVGSVAAGAFLVGAGAALPVFQGFLQGVERFRPISVALAVYGLGRPFFAIPLILTGLGVAGALSAATIAAVAAAAIALWALRDILRVHGRTPVALELASFKPVIFGLFALTVLTNADVLAANAFLGESEAGTYSSASLVGKLAALLPAGVLTPVLLPRATARIEQGHDAARIVTLALFATAVFGVLLTAVLLAVPESFVSWAFGEQFAGARDLLAPCAAVMTLYGLINVNLTFAVALRDSTLIRLLGLAVAGQVILFGLLHDGPYELLAATGLAALIVIVPHEIRSPVAVWRLLRSY